MKSAVAATAPGSFPLRRLLALVLILLVAVALRTVDLDRRPMHADEANQAVKAGLLLEGGNYAFDPHDHHGPTLYFLTVPLAYLRGEHSLATLSETTVRLVPALAGTLGVALLAGLGGGAGIFLLAAGFLAVSPPAVYYARDYIQETLLVTFTLLAVLAAASSARAGNYRGRRAWALVAGGAVGLMLATKESALLLIIAAAVAAVFARWFAPERPEPVEGLARPAGDATPPSRWADLLLGVAAAVFVAVLFYTSFFRHPAGLRDALFAPAFGLQRATGWTGHEKPWGYYLQLLTYTSAGGLVWEQWLFAALAVIGAAAGVVRRDAWLCGAALYAVLLLLALSLVPYKTPWNVLNVVPPLCLLSAGGVRAIARLASGRIAAAALAALAFASLLTHTLHAAFSRPADARNPWAYVQSSPDVRKFRPLVAAALAAEPAQPVRVISAEYWPLPWYLRGLPRIGYWNTPPAECDGALVITSADLAQQVRSRLRAHYRESFLGLRPGVVCVVFTPAP